MSMNEPNGYDANAVPPVFPGELGTDQEPAKWPTVIGVISIVLGGLGILKNGCGAVMNLAMGGGMGMGGMFGPGGSGSQAQQQQQIEQAMKSMGPWIMAVGVVSVLSLFVSVLLLVAGIQMVKRKSSGAGLHRTWAWVRILTVVVETAAGAVVQTAMMNAMVSTMPASPGGPTPAGMSQLFMAFAVAGACFGLLLGLAYPIVVLIVLGKRWAKDEVARWVAAESQMRFGH